MEAAVAVAPLWFVLSSCPIVFVFVFALAPSEVSICNLFASVNVSCCRPSTDQSAVFNGSVWQVNSENCLRRDLFWLFVLITAEITFLLRNGRKIAAASLLPPLLLLLLDSCSSFVFGIMSPPFPWLRPLRQRSDDDDNASALGSHALTPDSTAPFVLWAPQN